MGNLRWGTDGSEDHSRDRRELPSAGRPPRQAHGAQPACQPRGTRRFGEGPGSAAAAAAKRDEAEAPHLIYVPEVDFDIDCFIEDVDRVYSERGRCVIAVSEGIHDADGESIAAKLMETVERDSHGNVQLSGSGALGDHLVHLIKERLGERLRVRADTFGYLQRSFPGCVSEVDQREARAVSRLAAEMAVEGVESGSLAIQRKSNSPYQAEFCRVEFSDVAAKTRTLPLEYVVDGSDIDPSFREYLAPLLGEMPIIEKL